MLDSEILFAEVRAICAETLVPARVLRESVAACLEETYRAIYARHMAGARGKVVCAAHALSADLIVRYLYENFIGRRKSISSGSIPKFCIVALGGYGRSELSPKSDIDILFLHSPRNSDAFKTAVVDGIAYPLWDAGLKLGHSSRTYREAVADAQSDFILRNSMLDARTVCGDAAVYSKFRSRFDALCSARKDEHFDGLMRLKRDRHAKCGWTPYLQEPNVKNGIGGLRDAQTMRWKTLLNFGSDNLLELVSRSIISVSEYKAVRRAYEFLLRVRNDMHYHFGRANDLLDLETQPKIAEHLGFSGEGEGGVEEFMRRVYSSFRAIDSVSKTARKRMGLSLPDDVIENMRHMGTRLPANRKFSIDGFSFYRGDVDAISTSVFSRDPSKLVKVFALFQKYGAVPSDRLEVLIKDSRRLVDDSVRSDPATISAFLSILENRGSVFPTLELMHYWGVLGAFVPEFKDITCMVQHEFYHRFTADMHILNTIAQLDKIFRARESDGVYWEYHNVLVSSPAPNLLYLMLFLHDIGKGDGIRGHAEVGAEIGAKILARWGVPKSDADSILFVVKNHLQMARFWQTHDVEDESSIEEFAAIAKNAELLKYLYVLTFCDAMGTADGFWNSYKQSLHTSLYKGTLSYFRKRNYPESVERRKSRVFGEALETPQGAHLQPDLLELMRNLPRNYFMFHGRNDLIMHAGMLRQLRARRKNSAPVIEWRDEPNDSISRLYVASRDSGGLFAILAGVVTLSGLDILGSKIFTCSDGMVLDAFYVRGIFDGMAANPKMKSRFESEVRAALSGEVSLDRRVDEMFYADTRAAKDGGGEVVSGVSIRRSQKKIALEIRARDRVGLLYKVARAIGSCGYDIEFARVNTERNWAQDAFRLSPRPLAEPPSVLEKTVRGIF